AGPQQSLLLIARVPANVFGPGDLFITRQEGLHVAAVISVSVGRRERIGIRHRRRHAACPLSLERAQIHFISRTSGGNTTGALESQKPKNSVCRAESEVRRHSIAIFDIAGFLFSSSGRAFTIAVSTIPS